MLRRRKPLRRSTKPIKRKVPPKRRGKPRFKGREDLAYRAWVRARPCALAPAGACYGRIDPAHVKSRGTGGYDRKNLVPLCRFHHDQQHTLGIKTFELRHGLKGWIAKTALQLWFEYSSVSGEDAT